MNNELQSLQNMAKACNLYVIEAPEQDKRKKTKKYIAVSNTESVSPRLAYNELNHFLLGWMGKQKKSNSKEYEALSYLTACNTSDRIKMRITRCY